MQLATRRSAPEPTCESSETQSVRDGNISAAMGRNDKIGKNVTESEGQ